MKNEQILHNPLNGFLNILIFFPLATWGEGDVYTFCIGWCRIDGTDRSAIRRRDGGADEPFTFTLSNQGMLRVTDGYADGDQYEIFNFGTSLGSTSTPTDDGSGAGGG